MNSLMNNHRLHEHVDELIGEQPPTAGTCRWTRELTIRYDTFDLFDHSTSELQQQGSVKLCFPTNFSDIRNTLNFPAHKHVADFG